MILYTLGLIEPKTAETWLLKSNLRFRWNLTIILAKLFANDIEAYVLTVTDLHTNTTLLEDSGFIINVSLISAGSTILMSIQKIVKIHNVKCKLTFYCYDGLKDEPYVYAIFQLINYQKRTGKTDLTNTILVLYLSLSFILVNASISRGYIVSNEIIYQGIGRYIDSCSKLQQQLDLSKKDMTHIDVSYSKNRVFRSPCQQLEFTYRPKALFFIWEIWGLGVAFIDLLFYYISLPFSDRDCTMCWIKVRHICPNKRN